MAVFGNMWITLGEKKVPIATQYGILKGGLEQGTSVVFFPPESRMGREAGVKQ